MEVEQRKICEVTKLHVLRMITMGGGWAWEGGGGGVLLHAPTSTGMSEHQCVLQVITHVDVPQFISTFTFNVCTRANVSCRRCAGLVFHAPPSIFQVYFVIDQVIHRVGLPRLAVTVGRVEEGV